MSLCIGSTIVATVERVSSNEGHHQPAPRVVNEGGDPCLMTLGTVLDEIPARVVKKVSFSATVQQEVDQIVYIFYAWEYLSSVFSIIKFNSFTEFFGKSIGLV